MGVSIALTFSCIFSIAALVLVAVSFSTDFWLEFNINEANLAELKKNPTLKTEIENCNELFINRNLGLFRLCYEGTNEWMDKLPDTIDVKCLPEKGYDIKKFQFNQTEKKAYGTEKMDERTIYKRAQWILAALGLFIILISAALCPAACWRQNHPLIITTAIFALLGAACYLVSMGLYFHITENIDGGIDNLQTKDSKVIEWFPKLWSSTNSKHKNTLGPRKDIKEDYNESLITIKYGYSFICGWMGGIISLVSCFVTFCTAFCMNVSDEELSDMDSLKSDKKAIPSSKTNTLQPQQPQQQIVQPTYIAAQPAYVYPVNTLQSQHQPQPVFMHPGYGTNAF